MPAGPSQFQKIIHCLSKIILVEFQEKEKRIYVEKLCSSEIIGSRERLQVNNPIESDTLYAIMKK